MGKIMKEKYKKLTNKERTKFLKYLSAIKIAGESYQNIFVGKRLRFYTSSKKYIELIAEKSNFMHLCGVKYTTGSINFYKDVLNNKIDVNKILVKTDGTTFQKLQVIANLKDLVSKHVQLVEHQHFLYLEFDYALKTNKQILALTLIDKNYIIRPQSLLNLKNTNKRLRGKNIVRIDSEDLKTKIIDRLL